MLSNKMTFSLVCFVMLIAFVPAALAAIDTEPAVDLSVADVSSTAGGQIEAYPAIATTAITDFALVDTVGKIDTLTTTVQAGDVVFFLKITNEGVASLAVDSEGAAIGADIHAAGTADGADEVAIAAIPANSLLYISDLSIVQFDKLGIPLAEPINNAGSKIEHRSDAVRDGRNFMVTLAAEDVNGAAAFMRVQLPKGAFQHAAPADVRAAHFDKDKALKWNAESGILLLELVKEEPEAGDPDVVSLVRAADTITRGADQGATGVFSQAAVSGPFDVKVTFTEEPNGAIADIIDVKRGTVTRVIKGTPFYVRPHISEGNYAAAGDIPLTTGRDRRYHSYLLTITPNLAKGDETVEVAVKAFDDLVIPANSRTPPANLSLAHNRYLLIVPVNPAAITDIFEPATKDKPSNEVFLSDGLVIAAGGYLVITQGTAAQSGVAGSPAKLVDKKLAAQELYNVKNELAFPSPGNDLEALFRVGGTIRLSHADVAENKPAADAKVNDDGYLLSSTAYTAGSVVISEIMWGRDVSLGDADAVKSQWIELHNPGTEDISIDKNEWTLTFYQGSGGTAGTDVIDEVSNASPYWPPLGKSGATQVSRREEVTITQPDKTKVTELITEDFDVSSLGSMYRKIDGTTVMSGTSEASWAASTIAGSLNLSGFRAGTPGAATPYTSTPEPEPEPEIIPTAPVATAGDLMISEIMVASNEGRLPQWIEITNVSASEASLMGWVVSIANDSADAGVVASSLGIKLDGVTLDAGQSALVVSKLSNRNSGVAARAKGDANAGALDSNRIVDAQSQVNPPTATYSLLSEMAFQISLEPPRTGGIIDRGDVAGNLGGGWDLEMAETGRSSLIRREMGDAGEIMGTDAAGWVLASDTGGGGAYVETFYGDKDDVGTPGYDAGGALPVELSKFVAARDRVTGQVMITWETQSELNNAGFYIKRSQQRNGNFGVVNPTMVQGAGTTSEKQSYTYTDTTAQPNIVYYYQIEDVSFDGNRQTLTRGHRLKGHIGAAGKATTTWGELKEQQ